MLSRNLICFSHPCHRGPSKPRVVVRAGLHRTTTVPLESIKVNLDFISRLPKLLEINWNCIYVWDKIKILHRPNNSLQTLSCSSNLNLKVPEDRQRLKTNRNPPTPVHKHAPNLHVSEENKPLMKLSDSSLHSDNASGIQSPPKITLPPSKIPNPFVPLNDHLPKIEIACYTANFPYIVPKVTLPPSKRSNSAVPLNDHLPKTEVAYCTTNLPPIPKEIHYPHNKCRSFPTKHPSLPLNAQTPEVEKAQYNPSLKKTDTILDMQRKMSKKTVELSLSEEFDEEDKHFMMRIKNRNKKLEESLRNKYHIEKQLLPFLKQANKKVNKKVVDLSNEKSEFPRGILFDDEKHRAINSVKTHMPKQKKENSHCTDYDKAFRDFFDFHIF